MIQTLSSPRFYPGLYQIAKLETWATSAFLRIRQQSLIYGANNPSDVKQRL